MIENSTELVSKTVKTQVYIVLKSENRDLSEAEFDEQFRNDPAVKFMFRDLKIRFQRKQLSFLRFNEEVERYSLTILDSMTETLKCKAVV